MIARIVEQTQTMVFLLSVHLYGINFCLTGVIFLLHIILGQVQIHFQDLQIPEFLNPFSGRISAVKIFEKRGLTFDPQSILEKGDQEQDTSSKPKDPPAEEQQEVENQENAEKLKDDLIEKIDALKWSQFLYLMRRMLFFLLVLVYLIAILANVV